MVQLAWLTPDNLPTQLRRVTLYVPDDLDFYAMLKGALVPLFSSENFEEHGTLTPDECSQFWVNWDAENDWKNEVTIGSIIFTAGDTKPDCSLWCDGAEVAQAAYPVLYAAIGDTFGSASSGYFKLPDLQDRFPAGSVPETTGNLEAGDTGGEVEHTLTTDEIPSHAHSVHAHDLGVIGLELLPASTPAITGGQTGSAGGGEGHNNMPPYLTLNAYIIAE